VSSVLAWLLIPIAAVALGLAWATWRGRAPRPVEAERGMEDRERFRQAMEKPLPSLTPSPRDEDGFDR